MGAITAAGNGVPMSKKQPNYIIPELPEIALGNISPKKDLSIHITSEGVGLLPDGTFPPGWYEFPLEWPCIIDNWFGWPFVLRRALFSHETINQTLQGGENANIQLTFQPIDYTIHHPRNAAYVRRYTFYDSDGKPLGNNITVNNAQDLTNREDYNTLRKIIFRAQRYERDHRQSRFDHQYDEIAERISAGERLSSIATQIAERDGLVAENLVRGWNRTGKKRIDGLKMTNPGQIST